MPPLASRPSGFNPSRLRTGSAARSACGFCCRVPATMGKTLACATACCTRLRKSVPSSMLALGRPHVTEGCSPARCTFWQDFHSAPALCCRRSGCEAFRPVVGEQELARVRVYAGSTVLRRYRGSPVTFRGRSAYARPWLVVNPGGGTAMPRAL